jgi:hypothetical protein
MKRRRPKRSRSQPTIGSTASPANPEIPVMRPAISSPPPLSSTQRGSRKKKAKFRKKRKFAAATRKKARGIGGFGDGIDLV